MNKIFLYLLLLLPLSGFSQKVNYSPLYFGPTANPVPEFTDATIDSNTHLGLRWGPYFGHGDETTDLRLSVEIPLLPTRVSFKIWGTVLEEYKVSQEVYDFRQMEDNPLNGWVRVGDIYVQTRIVILKEKGVRPSFLLNSTLKTASGNRFLARRSFNTPGYYFDLEIGKSAKINSKPLTEIRGVIDLGFFSWETTNSEQDDAPIVGGKLILSNPNFSLENTLSGYFGWMDNGDKPLVYSSKFIWKKKKLNLFLHYQHGIHDFPFEHLEAGIQIFLPKLTPRFIKDGKVN